MNDNHLVLTIHCSLINAIEQWGQENEIVVNLV